MTHNVSNSHVIQFAEWVDLYLSSGRGGRKGGGHLILEGLMQNRVSRFWTSRGWHLEKDSAEAQPIWREQGKRFHMLYMQREFLPFPLKFFPWPSGKHCHHHHHHHHHHWFEWLFWNWNQIWIKCLLETVWNHSSSSIKAAILVY